MWESAGIAAKKDRLEEGSDVDSSKIQARSFRKEIERRVFENTRSMKRKLIGGVCVKLVAMKART